MPGLARLRLVRVRVRARVRVRVRARARVRVRIRVRARVRVRVRVPCSPGSPAPSRPPLWSLQRRLSLARALRTWLVRAWGEGES